MNEFWDIYHGSENKLEAPLFDYGKVNNDYGQGFYCTKDKDIAGEWACQKQNGGFINSYKIDVADLKVLYLNSKKYNILNWISILIQNRGINNIENEEAQEFLMRNYYIDTTPYDIITGYRADDSYFSFAKDFANNAITIQTLEKAMRLGKLGNQIMIKSKKAFDALQFQGAIVANKDIYFSLFKKRDTEARDTYKKLKKNQNIRGLYLIDVIRNPNLFKQYLRTKYETSYER